MNNPSKIGQRWIFKGYSYFYVCEITKVGFKIVDKGTATHLKVNQEFITKTNMISSFKYYYLPNQDKI